MTTVAVDLARRIDGPDLVAALEAMGLRGEVVDERVLVRVPDGSAEDVVAYALDSWIYDRQLPLVPLRLDRGSYAVMPPAA